MLTANKVRATLCAHRRGDRWLILQSEQRLKYIGIEQQEAGKSKFRPTGLMEKVSMFVEENPGATYKLIKAMVKGKAEYRDQALAVLIAEGYVEMRRNGQSKEHHGLRPYRADD